MNVKNTKFQPSTPKRAFSNWGSNEGSRKMCVLTENWPYLGNAERYSLSYY